MGKQERKQENGLTVKNVKLDRSLSYSWDQEYTTTNAYEAVKKVKFVWASELPRSIQLAQLLSSQPVWISLE
ncbi:hypothetical protein [Bacillus sp. JCM 19041]|uniref:hypothetical protein n=1 Tax=Bacillus sp. JCM 19041 TaxID=1460637 RepID=UPI0006D043FC